MTVAATSSATALVDQPPAPSVLYASVPGEPEGARRHRVARRGAKVVSYHGDDHAQAEGRVMYHLRRAWRGEPILGPVAVAITTWHSRPQRLMRKRDRGAHRRDPFIGKPDADNIAKLVLDAATKAGVWRDDTQVADLRVTRRYLPLTDDGVLVGLPRTEVRVWTL